MSKTLLQSVNEVLKRNGVVSGDSGALTTLTDSARQSMIDVAVQVINEGIDELYRISNRSMPIQQAEDRLVLVEGLRDYALPSDLNILIFPLIDRTNSQFIHEHKGGYNAMLLEDPEQDDIGLPTRAAINPVTNELHLNVAPTTSDSGREYVYQYKRDTFLSIATSTVPFDDAVFRAMVPVWSELWKREMRNSFDGALINLHFGRASRFLNKVQDRTSWSPR